MLTSLLLSVQINVFLFQILECSIKHLFVERDVSVVKSYVQRQCQKLLEGKMGLQDLIFAKEYRGMAGYKPAACVPALEIAKYVKILKFTVKNEIFTSYYQ